MDAPQALARIKPQGADEPGVELRHWADELPDCEPAHCVIEAFACHLPPRFVAAMAALAVPPRWINLEYLTAEEWADGCHGLSSRDPATGLTKHFFFPGFSARTGGLLRERDLFARRDAWRADVALQQATWARVGMQPQPGALQLSLFSYESPSIATLVDALSGRGQPAQLWVPEGRALTALSGALAQPLAAGDVFQRGALWICALPFMDQDDYDALLWHCDLNIVRGEDSFVRAQWAARPFLWHIYHQDESAHLAKLDAFLDRYTSGLDVARAARLRALQHGWNGDAPIAPADWSAAFADLPPLTGHAQDWAARLAATSDLATQLVLFNQTPI